MKDMFFNYDNKTNVHICPPVDCNCDRVLKSTDAISIVTNIRGEVLGVQVKHSNPFSLYFQLADFGTSFLSAEESLADLVLASKIKFELITISGKTIFTKEFSSAETFDELTSSLKLDFTHEESKSFKQEAHKMSVKLFWGDSDYYEIFTPENGLLIIR